jgi:hypothetical protein
VRFVLSFGELKSRGAKARRIFRQLERVVSPQATYFLVRNGDSMKLPRVSKIGNTDNTNFKTKTINAYCQFNSNSDKPTAQWNQPTIPTQLGSIGSSSSNFPFLLA